MRSLARALLLPEAEEEVVRDDYGADWTFARNTFLSIASAMDALAGDDVPAKMRARLFLHHLRQGQALMRRAPPGQPFRRHAMWAALEIANDTAVARAATARRTRALRVEIAFGVLEEWLPLERTRVSPETLERAIVVWSTPRKHGRWIALAALAQECGITLKDGRAENLRVAMANDGLLPSRRKPTNA